MITNGRERRIQCHGGCGLLLAVARNERAFLAPQRLFCPLCGADPEKNKLDRAYVFRRRLQSWLANGGRDIAAEIVADATRRFLAAAIAEEARRSMARANRWRVAA